MELPKISIVTPAFQSASTIEETITSVLGQNYPNLEYIIIDGGSDDGTREIIASFENRISYWSSEPDQGHYHAVRKGFEHASGDIFFWINSDDMLLPTALQKVGEIFRDLPQIEWLTSVSPGYWDEDGGLHSIGKLPLFSLSSFLAGRGLPTRKRAGASLQQESTFFSAALWQKTQHVITNFGLAGDFALWCEMWKHAKLYNCRSPLGGFRSRTGQLSENYGSYVDDALKALQELRHYFGWSPFKTPLQSMINLLPSRKMQFLCVYGKPYKAPVVMTKGKKGHRNWMIKESREFYFY